MSAPAIVGGIALGRKLVGDRIEAAIRKPGGKWQHGRFTIDHKGAVFERYRWQMRIPSGNTTSFTVIRLGNDTGQRPPFHKMLTINPQLHIVSFDTDQGRYEVGMLPSRIDEFRDRLQPQGVEPLR